MIRKSATGIIVALAVIWGGGTWYTGTQIQPGVEKFIKDFNDAKKKGEHAYDMTLSYKNFDKGFFNSHFQMQITLSLLLLPTSLQILSYLVLLLSNHFPLLSG